MWDSYFDQCQTQARDGRVWFALTLTPLRDGGADRLLTYFGGESIYMPLTQDEEISAVLKTIGEPLIVESELDAGKLRTFSEIPWGKIWVSSYHAAVYRKASQFDVDGYLTEPVPANRVVAVRVAKQGRQG